MVENQEIFGYESSEEAIYMGMYQKDIFGKWREVWSAHVNINGEWKDVDVNTFNKEYDYWKGVHTNFIDPMDIQSFLLVYTINDHLKYHRYQKLVTNKNLPIIFDLTGESKDLDFSEKGVVYRYERFGYDEGKLLFEGHLYALLTNGVYIDVGFSYLNSTSKDIRMAVKYDEMKEVWITSRLKDTVISIDGYESFEGFKFEQFGWNSLFTKDQLVFGKTYTEEDSLRKQREFKQRICYPDKKRDQSYYPCALIGIARELKDEHTMHGAFGNLNHTITSISVNGINKPFQIKIYPQYTDYPMKPEYEFYVDPNYIPEGYTKYTITEIPDIVPPKAYIPILPNVIPNDGNIHTTFEILSDDGTDTKIDRYFLYPNHPGKLVIRVNVYSFKDELLYSSNFDIHVVV